MQICAKRHRGQSDRRSKSDCRRNESGHEPERWMINLREKMVLASGAGQRGAEFAVAERATKRDDSADDPQHQQRKPRLNACQLKPKAREDAGANDVGNDNGTCCEKADATRGRSLFHSGMFSDGVHRSIDNRQISGNRELFRSYARIHIGNVQALKSSHVRIPELSEVSPGMTLRAA